jgi:hypothetical protein
MLLGTGAFTWLRQQGAAVTLLGVGGCIIIQQGIAMALQVACGVLGWHGVVWIGECNSWHGTHTGMHVMAWV